MAVTAVSATIAKQASGTSITLNAGSVAVGDLMIVLLGCFRVTTGVSTGWTEVLASGSSGQYLRAAWRIADGSANDACTYSFALSSQAVMMRGVYNATVGFDGNSLKQYTGNSTSSSATSYALSGSLSSVLSGELPVFMGGHSMSSSAANTASVTGTSWTSVAGTSNTDLGHGAWGTSNATGTISAPSLALTSGVTSIKFVAGFTLREAAGAGGSGLFFGSC